MDFKVSEYKWVMLPMPTFGQMMANAIGILHVIAILYEENNQWTKP